MSENENVQNENESSEKFKSDFDDNKNSAASEPIEVTEVPSEDDVVNPNHEEDENPESLVGDEVSNDG